MDYIARAREVLDIEAEGLTEARNALGPTFAAAVDLILAALSGQGKIVVTGIGKNLHIAEKISATLASTGSTSVVLNPSQALHGDLGILCEGDVVLALSYSGESDEILSIVPTLRRSGISIVALTGDENSSLARLSDVAVSVKVTREACPFNMAPTSSTTLTLAIGDALAMVLLEAQGFRREDYAKLHPGGAIGRALLLRARDVMRPPDRLAVVESTSTVKAALLAMTHARSGSAGVVDADGRVVGVFTDGDLRRLVADKDQFLDLAVAQAMTPSPITVQADQLAVDVLRIYEQHNIDDLLVVDTDRHIVGAIDIQDLPKLKIL